MKVNSNYFPIVIFAAIAFGILLGGWLNIPGQDHFFVKNISKNKLNKLLDFINNEYVDSVNSDSIMKHTIDNVLGQLDPHSIYIPASEQEQVAESMRGDFVGIGVNFYMYKDSRQSPRNRLSYFRQLRLVRLVEYKLNAGRVAPEYCQW